MINAYDETNQLLFNLLNFHYRMDLTAVLARKEMKTNISQMVTAMDTYKRVAPPIPFVFLLLCNACDVSSFATQNSKQTV